MKNTYTCKTANRKKSQYMKNVYTCKTTNRKKKNVGT